MTTLKTLREEDSELKYYPSFVLSTPLPSIATTSSTTATVRKSNVALRTVPTNSAGIFARFTEYAGKADHNKCY